MTARMLEAQGAALDPVVRLGLARSHGLLVLLASAMTPRSHGELLAKHEALAHVRPLDPALGGLRTVVAAALSADWSRFEQARRRHEADAPPSGLH